MILILWTTFVKIARHTMWWMYQRVGRGEEFQRVHILNSELELQKIAIFLHNTKNITVHV